MRQNLRYFLFLFGVIFLVGMVSASVTCTSSTTLSSTNPSSLITCSNSGSNNITLYSSSPQDFYLTGAGVNVPPLILANSSGTQIYLHMISGASSGSYFVQDSSGNHLSDVSITVAAPNSACQLVPLQYTQTYPLTQGQTGLGNEIDVLATNCNNLDTTSWKVSQSVGMTKPFYISSSGVTSSNQKEYAFTLGIDAKGISTGTYSNTYTVQATNNGSVVTSSPMTITAQVSAGVSPITNFTLSDLPTCSLDKSQIALNSSLTLTCTNLISNIQINALPNNFVQGSLPTITSTQETWKITPLKTGNYNLSLYYTYQGVQVGNIVSLPFRVTLTGTAQAGTAIKPEFFPALNQLASGQPVIIQAVDNKTNSLLSNAKFYLNGEQFNGTTKLTSGQVYSLRISDTADGYQDYVDNNLTIAPRYVNINLTAPNGFISGNELIINTTPANASLSLDGNSLSNKSLVMTAGNHTLEATDNGYISTYKNFSVSPSVQIVSSSVWQKGQPQTFVLNQVVSYTVSYAKDAASTFSNLASGLNKTISFTPNDPGIYTISANGKQIYSGTIKGLSINWLYWLGGGVGVLLILILIVAIVKGTKKRPSRGGHGFDYFPEDASRQSVEDLDLS